jgi:hypothetical protein
MTARQLPDDEMQTWDDFLGRAEGSSVHQASTYRKALSLYGYSSEVLVTETSRRVTGGALLAIRRLGPMVGPLVRTSGGLALEDGADPTALSTLLDAVLDRCRQRKASRVEVSLRIPLRTGDATSPTAEALARTLRDAGFRPDATQGTYQIGLTANTDDELLQRFGKTPRTNIQKAVDEGVVVDRAQDEDYGAFEEAHLSMCRRKGYGRLPAGFATGVFLPLARAGLGELFVARYRDVPRNYIFVGCTTEPIRHERAVTEAGEEADCPEAETVLHYTAMRHFRSQGKRFYDLGGAEGPVPDPTHSNYATWKFKHEFNGTYVRFIGTWGRTLRPLDSALLGLVRRGLGLVRRGLGLKRRLVKR